MNIETIIMILFGFVAGIGFTKGWYYNEIERGKLEW